MFEVWTDPPLSILKLAKYLLGPTGVILFVLAVPILWIVPQRMFRRTLLVTSTALLMFSWGPTFTVLLLTLLVAAYPLVAGGRRVPGWACFGLVAVAHAALFYLPLAHLPVVSDRRLAAMYPGLLTDRELVFYSGLAFTTLRYLHLVFYARRDGPWRAVTLSRYLLYLLYAPTYRLGPYLPYDSFDAEVATAHERRSSTAVFRGFTEVLLGVLVFEIVIQWIDRGYFKQVAVDDGSFWHYGFFESPPHQVWLTLLGIYLLALRYYLLIKAYSHVAIGISCMLGIRLPPNMKWPILSANLVEFWRRYHVTVSQYAQRHVLTPVAERVGHPAAAVLAAFVFIGLWHRPAWHTLLWALLQVLGIGMLLAWRRATAPMPVIRRVLPFWVRRSLSTVLTLWFVAHTVPILLDMRYGGMRLAQAVIFGDWTFSLSLFRVLWTVPW